MDYSNQRRIRSYRINGPFVPIEVHYGDVKQAILATASLTSPTRSHGPARTSVGNSAVQRILNKYNFTVGKAQPTKHRAGD